MSGFTQGLVVKLTTLARPRVSKCGNQTTAPHSLVHSCFPRWFVQEGANWAVEQRMLVSKFASTWASHSGNQDGRYGSGACDSDDTRLDGRDLVSSRYAESSVSGMTIA